ncbi:hypothetical protein CAEBREN_25603 [Caenorhabditis brenneri]|uniref:Uncharacterized protein n=1 Tax=Caenorhabditis brenneri TaxID=135651 RepID=G0N113_CAEBE|nr:hypothetical protein CAEBREN_25603 [Caenorhabditis brenneri]
MVRIIPVLAILLLFFVQILSSSVSRRMAFAKPGARLEIDFYETPKNITRQVYNAKDVQQTHVYRICNGNNQKKCGFWENVKNKQKVGPKTNFNKKTNKLVIPKARKLDAGEYYVDRMDIVTVYVM